MKFKLGLDFPNLPYLIDGNIKVTQSNAILRYLGRKFGLDGKTEADKVSKFILFFLNDSSLNPTVAVTSSSYNWIQKEVNKMKMRRNFLKYLLLLATSC